MSAVPVGGTTGLDHNLSAAFDEAALWVATPPAGALPSQIVLDLGRRFGLTSGEACVALREAALIRGRTY